MTKPIFSPESLPLQSIAGEGAIAPVRLTAGALRERFLLEQSWQPEIQAESPLLSVQRFREAAVLVPLVMRPEGLSVLLTQRADDLQHHAGQISFPGGRVEPEDLSLTETALRETEEEIGLLRDYVEVLGCLPDYLTGTGYQVTPVVALIREGFDLHAEPSEVAEVFEVPLPFLMNAAHHQRRIWQLPDGAQRTFYAMPYQQYFIWGATAGMLRNLFHFLRA